MSEYSYFPGCSAASTGISYTMSYDAVAKDLGVALNEITDWNCCGATAAHSESHHLAYALSARSLALSEEQYGEMPILAPCAGCYLHLKGATMAARENEEVRTGIEAIIERPWQARAEVVNGLVPFAGEEMRAEIAKRSQGQNRGITDMKVACYYGCALVRPVEVCQPDSDEHPQVMEEILKAAGASPVEWSFANECCGASHQVSIPKVGRAMVRRILENAAASGAEAIACACPLCMLNLDMREDAVNAARAAEGLEPLNLPIYYFTELLGAAFGHSISELGVDRHFQKAETTLVRALVREPAPQVDPEAEKAARIAAAKKKAAERKAAKAKEAAAKPQEASAKETAPKPKEAAPKETAKPATPEGKEAANE